MTKRLWLLVLVVLLAVPLVFLLRDYVRDVLLVELLRILWVGQIIFESLPQPVVWGLFVVIVLLVAFRSLVVIQRFVPGEPDVPAEHAGQVRALAARIRHAKHGRYYSWHLARHLAKLIVEVLAYHQGLPTAQIRWRVRSGTLDAPEEIRAYLEIGRQIAPRSPVGCLPRLRHALAGEAGEAPTGPSLETVVQFLEDQLEV